MEICNRSRWYQIMQHSIEMYYPVSVFPGLECSEKCQNDGTCEPTTDGRGECKWVIWTQLHKAAASEPYWNPGGS